MGGFRNSARLRRAHILTKFCGQSHEIRNPRIFLGNGRPSRTGSNHPQSQDAVESGHGSNTLRLKAD
eukprot:scaffold11996_cov73-Cyclotella_meneghiniana.AAC.2